MPILERNADGPSASLKGVPMGRQSKRRTVTKTGAIERKALLQIAKALILGMRNSLTDPIACIKQRIVEELAAVLGMERCVIFKICRG